MTIADIFTYGVPALAAIGSWIGVWMMRRQVKADAIAKSRIQWIDAFRCLTGDFIDAYVSEFSNRDKRQQLYFRTALFVNGKNPAYVTLLKSMDLCVADNEKNLKHIDDVCFNAQNLLSEVWLRAKRESGISRREDRKQAAAFDAERSITAEGNAIVQRMGAD